MIIAKSLFQIDLLKKQEVHIKHTYTHSWAKECTKDIGVVENNAPDNM